MRPCQQCGKPPTSIGAVSTDYDGTDPRHTAFIEFAATHGQPDDATWLVYECRNPACGCGCRQYIPVRPVAVP